MRYYVAVLALALLSCTTNFVKPASVENTPVQRLSEEDREYLVESYRKSYLKVIREKSELDAFTFPLLKEAIEVASSISDDVVPKKFRKYTSGYSYGFSLIGNHLINDFSDESLEAWKRLGVSQEDTFRTVFNVFKSSAAERAGLAKGDRISMQVQLFMDEKSRLYLTQDQEKSRQKYSLPVGYGDPKTGELKGIFFQMLRL